MKAQGSCLCGKIRYEVNKTSDNIDHCHCTYCQKFHGAAFGTYIEPVTPENFIWLEGEKLVSRYQSSSHSARLFCSVCGSALSRRLTAARYWRRPPPPLTEKLKSAIRRTCSGSQKQAGARLTTACRNTTPIHPAWTSSLLLTEPYFVLARGLQILVRS